MGEGDHTPPARARTISRAEAEKRRKEMRESGFKAKQIAETSLSDLAKQGPLVDAMLDEDLSSINENSKTPNPKK